MPLNGMALQHKTATAGAVANRRLTTRIHGNTRRGGAENICRCQCHRAAIILNI
jgi:hypothetical protein